jgi:hypothetical protein
LKNSSNNKICTNGAQTLLSARLREQTHRAEDE